VLERIAALGALTITVFLVAACASIGRGSSHAGGSVTITPESAGRTIELRSVQELLVRLPSNPATGYRWSLAAAPADVLKLEGLPSFERYPGGAGAVGAPGIEIWRFSLARKGQQILRFDYRLPWEADAPPARQLSFTVTVR
jgi:inhibitor of cysteine peptidase